MRIVRIRKIKACFKILLRIKLRTMNEFSHFSVPSSIRGYNVYQTIWEPRIAEILECCRERNNSKDRYAVCVKKDNAIAAIASHC